jgi:hypothetical protein
MIKLSKEGSSLLIEESSSTNKREYFFAKSDAFILVYSGY